MRGLDPRIHQTKYFKRMDCRVKPGNDELCIDIQRYVEIRS